MSNIARALGVGPPKSAIVGFSPTTSLYNAVLPLLYGTDRIAGNLLQMPDGQPSPQGKAKSVIGKGGGAQTTYVASVVIALCEGPINAIIQGWIDKQTPQDWTTGFVSQGWEEFVGTGPGQTPWAYLSSHYPTAAYAYPYVAYIARQGAPFPNDSMPQMSFEVKSAIAFNADANGKDIIVDYLTHPAHGAGFLSSWLGDLSDYETYCYAADLLVSPTWDSQQPAREQLSDLMEATNSAPVWSDGQLVIRPYGDTVVTANGHTYTPDTTPIYDLGDNDFIPVSGAPAPQQGTSSKVDRQRLVIARADLTLRANRVPISFKDRAFDYNANVTQSDWQLGQNGPNGVITLTTIDLPLIKRADVALSVATFRVQREQCVVNEYKFRLGIKFSLLEPMDLVTLTSIDQGLSKTPVRIIEILENGNLYDVTAEDWPFGTASATLNGGAPSTSGTMPDTNVDPGDVTSNFIIDAPTPLISAPMELWIGASGGPDWGGCNVWIANASGGPYVQYGTITGKAASGVLTANIATGAQWPSQDTTHTLAVDISASGETIASQSSADFDRFANFYVTDNGSGSGQYEVGTWETSTLTSVGHYSLTTLYRGIYGSLVAAHSAGDQVYIVDEHTLRIAYPQVFVGGVIYVKFQSFNTFGAATQDLSGLTPVVYAPGQTPLVQQNSASQGTVAIDVNGAWEATSDGGGRAFSYRYLTSTSGFPSDISVQTGGTIINGRSFTASGGPLSFGDTIYITLVPFSYLNATGPILPSVHIRGSYQTFSGTKTVTYAPGQWVIGTQSATAAGPPFIGTDGTLWFQADPGVAPNMNVVAFMVSPNNTTLIAAEVDAYTSSVAANNPQMIVQRQETAGVQTTLGSDTAAANGWQTLSVPLSEVTTGNAYQVYYAPFPGISVAGNVRVGNLRLTYSMPDPLQAI